ncbi:hypothetical protein HD806DRAFT_32221 [Xylariaceae sp. AK1471]|nr:hypothetical protein HD806DRAFT_32221 [Xylariaceae sp. AK1471]
MFVWVLVRMLIVARILENAGASRPQSDDSVKCDRIDKYTTEWFLANTKREYRGVPLSSNALFYSRSMSSAARALAEDQGRVTIWQVWPCYLYDHTDEPLNRMRCIHHSTEQRQSFFGNMSLAFAQKARGGAAVLHSSQNYPSPPPDGIWAKIELPELTKLDGPVDWLEKMRMHAEWPAEASEARQRAWLASNASIEWLKNLRVRDEMAKWSEVFWRRLQPSRVAFGKWDSEYRELKKKNGDENLLDEENDENLACKNRVSFGFFDDKVSW